MTKQLTFGSLFAGIGGFDLGFERAGMRCEWQVEIDPYCQRVLAKHWPNVRRWDDVRTFPPAEGDWRVDVICGGFPCQDISYAGRGAGLAGKRSGLWYEYARIVGDLGPRFIVVENVAALADRGLDAILGTFADLGFDAEWGVVPASAFGSPQYRERLFLLAYTQCDGRNNHETAGIAGAVCRSSEATCGHWPAEATNAGSSLQGVSAGANPLESRGDDRLHFVRAPWQFHGAWRNEPDLVRVVDGVPDGLDRLHGLGNAVVPQVAEWIGRRIVEAA